MAKLIHQKLNGSTLIEVLIAMVIIMVVFSIAIGLFNNQISGGVSYQKLKVQQQLQLLADQIQQQGKVEVQQLEIDGVAYEFVVHSSPVDVFTVVEIRATKNGTNLGNMKLSYDPKNESQN